jgi:hypothetical protein
MPCRLSAVHRLHFWFPRRVESGSTTSRLTRRWTVTGRKSTLPKPVACPVGGKHIRHDGDRADRSNSESHIRGAGTRLRAAPRTPEGVGIMAHLVLESPNSSLERM